VNIYHAHASSNRIDQIHTGFHSGYIDSVNDAIKCDNLSDLLVEYATDDDESLKGHQHHLVMESLKQHYK